VTKLLLIVLAVLGFANSFAADSAQPPLLIDKTPAATPLHAGD
jgi:hypothetical protein